MSESISAYQGKQTRPDACARRVGHKSGDRWCHRCWRAVSPREPLCAEGEFEPEWYVVQTKHGWRMSGTPF